MLPVAPAPQGQREKSKVSRANAQQEGRGTASELNASDSQRLVGTASQPCTSVVPKQVQVISELSRAKEKWKLEKVKLDQDLKKKQTRVKDLG